ncbi:MAG: sugar phosphate isomerase/epimerase [Verrucomicrobia bacterium]|nr:sugar phosphate isomerase/epimerase [Verrucomicrobiota bacterium]
MKLGASTLAYRRLPLAEALAHLRRLGFDTVDLGCIYPSYCPHFDPTAAGSSALMRIEDALAGLRVATLTIGMAPWNSPDRIIRTAQMEFAVGSLRVAKALGAYAVSVQSGTRPKTAAEWDNAAQQAAEAVRIVMRRAEALGVRLSVEIQWNALAETVEQAEQLLALINHPLVGVTVDTSHLVALGADPVAAIERLGSRVHHVHLRDAKPGDYRLTPGDGEVPFAAVAGALRKIGYDRACVIELEGDFPAAEADEQLRRARAHIEQAFAPPQQSAA